jgi:hypothetical protein
MFRTARAFLMAAPPAFALALASFLLSHAHAAEAFVPYPFLADAMGQSLTKRPVERFTMAAVFFFLLPYLVTGLLLLFADLGISAATPLWSKTRRRKGRRNVPPESRVAFAAVLALSSIAIGASLHKIAHGGELPGGVNVAPIFVAAVPFGAVAFGTLAAGLASLPRAIAARFGDRREAEA